MTSDGDGNQVVHYCGSAQARVDVGDRQVHIRGGRCEDRGEFFLINLGIKSSAPNRAANSYLGLLAGPARADASFTDISALTLTVDGRRIEVESATMTLRTQGDRAAGTVTGRASPGQRLRIHLRCDRTTPP